MAAKKNEIYSILNKGLTFEGTTSFKGKMIINGTVRGVIVGETLVIGKEGAVYADTVADRVTIGGVFEGKIRVANELIVLSTGRCSGEIECGEFVVEPGGVLKVRVSSGKKKNQTPTSKSETVSVSDPTPLTDLASSDESHSEKADFSETDPSSANAKKGKKKK